MHKTRSIIAAAVGLALWAAPALAQQRRVTGVVTESGSGQPLASASVNVVGTTTGAYTNDEGRYTITTTEGPLTLRVRRIGYRERTVTVAAGTNEANVTLERDVLQLETQVITGAATTISRQNAANDVAQVTGEELNRAPTPTIENALQGKIAGANIVTNSGAPGGGAQFRIRGASSILGNSDPLVIVDGVIVSNDMIQPGTNAVLGAGAGSNASSQDNGVNRLADLNPADVENIEVLKGASASNIYGSRASNGVVIITTKRGQTGRPAFSFTQRVGTFDLANKLGSKRFTLDEAIAAGEDIGLSEQEVRDNFARCNGYCDYEEQLYGRNPFSYETNLSVRGGSDAAQYYASGLIKHDGGIAPNSEYNKQSLRLNLNSNLSPKWTGRINTQLVHSRGERSLSNNDNVNVTPYFVFPATPSFFDLRARNGVYPDNPFSASNPLQTLNFVHTPEEVWRLIGSVSSDYIMFSSDRQTLTANVIGGIDQFNQQNSTISPRFLQFEPGDLQPGTVTLQSATNVYANGGVSLNHVFRPTGGQSFTTSAGFQEEYRSLRDPNIVTRDVLLGQENIQRGASTEAFDFRSRQVDQAFYAQEEWLGLGERLLLTGAVRGQRSTVNGDPNKFYMFPKAAASYRLPTFVPQINDIKLRVAYGESGNPPLLTAPFTPLAGSVYGGQNGVQIGGRLGDPNIKPERQAEIEGGIDIALFDSRASLSVTGYRRNLTDLLLRPALAPSTGYTQQDVNGGEMQNSGIEVALAATPIQGALQWISRVTFARNVGKVTKLPEIVGHVQCLTSGGDALQTNQSLCPRGFTAGAFGFEFGQGRLEEGASPTQIIGIDSLPDGTLFQRKYGDTEPQFSLGFGNEFTFGGFRLYGLIDWRHKFSIVNLTQTGYDAAGTAPDPDNSAKRLAALDAGLSPYIQDGSFVKLREITLSYAIPQRFATRMFGTRANNVSLELSGRNLITWTGYDGLDPEVSNFGNQNIIRNQDLAPFPPSRSYFLSLNFGF